MICKVYDFEYRNISSVILESGLPHTIDPTAWFLTA